MTDWAAHERREAARYADGESRLPEAADSDSRQRQLTRMGNVAAGAGLALLMDGRADEASEWLHRAAQRYRDSLVDAPADSWGRPIGAMKALVLAGDWPAAQETARLTVDSGAGLSESPIARYAAALAFLILEEDDQAVIHADAVRSRDDFPSEVGDALASIAAKDVVGYASAIESVLQSFELRDEYLEDVPVADTVLVLQLLAARRALAAELSSPLLPASSPH